MRDDANERFDALLDAMLTKPPHELPVTADDDEESPGPEGD